MMKLKHHSMLNLFKSRERCDSQKRIAYERYGTARKLFHSDVHNIRPYFRMGFSKELKDKLTLRRDPKQSTRTLKP